MNGASTGHRARIRLAGLLCEAAEIEHGLMCQYLFAAFSLKRGLDEGTAPQLEKFRRWEASILLVARQEMEHLALVCNMLTAIGEAPYLHRPNFPLRLQYAQLGTPSVLEPLSLPALERFIQFEMPTKLSDQHDDRLTRIFGPTYHHLRFTGIATLYREIGELFSALSPDDFVGVPYTQMSNDLSGDGKGKPLSGRGYEVALMAVTDPKSAQEAVKQILEEGEGTADSTSSHFARFLEIYDELAQELEHDPEFSPARNVGRRADDALPVRGWAGEMLAMFDLAYETLLLMLFRFIVVSDRTDSEEVAAMQQAAFFPMMTAVIRPLGEMLTRIRVGDDGFAAARFWFERLVAPVPDSGVARKVVHYRLHALAHEARRLSQPGKPEPADFRAVSERLSNLAENVERIARDFDQAAGIDKGAGI